MLIRLNFCINTNTLSKFRALEPMLAKYTTSTGARVIWVSSHEASSEFYDPKDWQLVKSEHSYESSKYQMNLLSLHLDREATRNQVAGKPIVRHITVLPGVAGTNIASALLGTVTAMCMFTAFYIVGGFAHFAGSFCLKCFDQARMLGSIYHPISAFKASISAVHLSLVPLAFLPVVSKVNNSDQSSDPSEPVEVGTLYISETDRWGRPRVGTIKLFESKSEEIQTQELLDNCDRLLKAFCDAEGRRSPSG